MREAEARIYEQEAADKPEKIREKIVAGKLNKWYQTIVLLEQEMHDPKFEGKTVQQLRDELTATTGENVVIRRFARFAVGAVGSGRSGRPGLQPHPAQALRRGADGRARLRDRSRARSIAVARQVAAVQAQGVEVAIVVGGGNIYRGMHGGGGGDGSRDRPTTWACSRRCSTR